MGHQFGIDPTDPPRIDTGDLKHRGDLRIPHSSFLVDDITRQPEMSFFHQKSHPSLHAKEQRFLLGGRLAM